MLGKFCADKIPINSHIVLENIGLNPTRIGFLKILEMMGADIKVKKDIAYISGERNLKEHK